ncbi:MAG: exonuclease SbcCD subunit D [Thermotogota bacterium]|nr:exonuclease SbcCD subunit D [Thermotogota bacterium]
MKILHTSDWHLGRRPVGGIGEYSEIRYEDYFNAAEYIVDKGIEESVDVFIIAGDLFDRSSIQPDILYRTEKLLQKLKEQNIEILVIEGNHDRSYRRQESWISYLERRELVSVPEMTRENGEYYFEPIVIDGVKFFGVPYQGLMINDALSALATKLDEQEDNIVIVHTGIVSWEQLPGCTIEETIDIFKNKVMYIAGGHLHHFQEYPDSNNGYFVVPGSPEYWDLGEKDEKGYVVFDTESRSYKFYPSKKRKLSNYSIKDSELEDFLESVEVQDKEIIRLEIINNSTQIVKTDEVEDSLTNKGALKIITIVKYAGEYGNVNLDARNTSDIEKKVIEEKWNNIFSANSEKTVSYLNRLKSQLNEDSQEDIIFDHFDRFLDHFVEEGETNESE